MTRGRETPPQKQKIGGILDMKNRGDSFLLPIPLF